MFYLNRDNNTVSINHERKAVLYQVKALGGEFLPVLPDPANTGIFFFIHFETNVLFKDKKFFMWYKDQFFIA